MNPSEIHHLVGLLFKVSQSQKAEIILGEFVYNKASKTKRDLDITMKYTDQLNNQHVFIGIEVKGHKKRPLDSAQTEQLCAKLNTHSGLTSKSIVSSSGYTKPAINIAKYYNICLYDLCDWDRDKVRFEHITFPKDFFILDDRTKSKVLPSSYKLLIPLSGITTKVGCVLFELSAGNLIGLTVSDTDRTLRLINIPVISRKLKKVYDIEI